MELVYYLPFGLSVLGGFIRLRFLRVWGDFVKLNMIARVASWCHGSLSKANGLERPGKIRIKSFLVAPCGFIMQNSNPRSNPSRIGFRILADATERFSRCFYSVSISSGSFYVYLYIFIYNVYIRLYTRVWRS